MEFRYPYDPATGLPGTAATPWTNGDPAQGVEGSIPPAEALNDPQREITNVIDYYLGNGNEGSGQQEGDLTQLRKSLQAATGEDGARSLHAETGYEILPSGLILQWGGGTIVTPSSTFFFPVSFPNAVFRISVVDYSAVFSDPSPAHIIHILSDTPSRKSRFQVQAAKTDGTSGTSRFDYIAIGH